MKARLVPIFFRSANMLEFNEQLECIKKLLWDEASFLEPVMIGSDIPEGDAVVFPQLIGEAYKSIQDIQKIKYPILLITSGFGTVDMWDWEIATFFKSRGLNVLTPYNIELTKTICRTLALKKEMKQTKFLVFQDNPGDGMQASIFKRFYWWEDECTQRIKDKFGITIDRRSFKKLAEDAKNISEQEALEVLKIHNPNSQGLLSKSLVSASKLYIALKHEIDGDENIQGAGINCLNESMYSDTTPCLAWDILFEEKGIMWACEADTMSLLTQYLLYKSIKQPVMTSNIYPFLIGKTALKHEKIEEFPNVDDPENYLLIAHCGYFGLMPRVFSSEWALKPKVLDIVDNNAVAVDARFAEGEVTIAKLHPSLDKLQVVEGVLEKYVKYPKSHCKNGGLIKIKDGRKLMNSFYSHHSSIMTGKRSVEIEMMSKILALNVEEV